MFGFRLKSYIQPPVFRELIRPMPKPLSIFFTTVGAIIFIAAASAQATPSPKTGPLPAVSGFWYTEGHEGGIQLYPCEDKICGSLYWMQDEKGSDGEDGVSRDTHNPDPHLRRRPLCHMKFMGNFTPDEQNHYGDGWIYNPHDGGIYSASMTLIDHNTLKLRGYLFFEFLGQSQIWTRATSMPSCAGAEE